jgi:ABC-type transporter Mla MlaB component
MPIPPRRTVALTIRAPLERSDLPGLIERTCLLLEANPCGVLMCDVEDVSADTVALNALARLALAAKRGGCEVHLLGAGEELVDLIRLVGLNEVLGLPS